jgi:hypothetical protein
VERECYTQSLLEEDADINKIILNDDPIFVIAALEKG